MLGMRVFWTAMLLASCPAQAVVIRHDVEDTKYQVDAAEIPVLADLAHEGHGVLVAPQWVVTAAHATQWHPVTAISLAGKCREVERVVVHPGYRDLKDAPAELKSGDAAPIMAWMAGSADIALIKLKEPVSGLAPLALYRGDDELGRQVKLYGKGATGDGVRGRSPHAPHRSELRRGFNTVDSVDPAWLGFRFDSGDAALALEGTSGSGDSGGPVLMEDQGRWVLAGIIAREHVDGDLATARSGFYGMRTWQVRISHYADWIDGVIAAGQADTTGSSGP